jgi:hypothetical protein
MSADDNPPTAFTATAQAIAAESQPHAYALELPVEEYPPTEAAPEVAGDGRAGPCPLGAIPGRPADGGRRCHRGWRPMAYVSSPHRSPRRW